MASSELFSPVSGGRISVKIVDQILPLILDGRLSIGERLPSERELAETFGVSRVTVRDALRVLEVMDLVEIRVGSRGGAFISEPSNSALTRVVANLLSVRQIDPDEVAEARVMIESAILNLAIERLTDEDIASMRELCERSKAALDAGEYSTQLSVEFHSRLARSTKNAAVTLLAESFAGPLSMAAVRAAEQPENPQERTVREHEALMEALEQRDSEAANELLRTHLLRNRPPREAPADQG